jgi:FkbM family methyltransferase
MKKLFQLYHHKKKSPTRVSVPQGSVFGVVLILSIYSVCMLGLSIRHDVRQITPATLHDLTHKSKTDTTKVVPAAEVPLPESLLRASARDPTTSDSPKTVQASRTSLPLETQTTVTVLPTLPPQPPPVDPFYQAGQPPKALQCSDLNRMPPIASKVATNKCVFNHSFPQMVHTLGDIVSEHIANYGCWETVIINSMVQHFGVTGTQRTFIDVGGNIGAFTTTMAQLGHQVITVEPFRLNVPLILQTLCHNKNNAMANVHLFKVALSDKSPGQKMCLWSTHSQINNGNARLVPYFEGQQDFGLDKDKECMEIIHSYTLDELLGLSSQPSQQQQPLLTSRPWGMKMDIEGYETLALRGAQQLIRHYPPCRIWFEYQREVTIESGAGATEIFELLTTTGNYTQLYFAAPQWKQVQHNTYGASGDYMAVHSDPECQVDLPVE